MCKQVIDMIYRISRILFDKKRGGIRLYLPQDIAASLKWKSGEQIMLRSDYDEFLNRSKYMSILTHVNVLSDHIAIQELNYDKKGHDRVLFIYVKVNGNGVLRLWCEVDNSYSCWHVKYAWTLPDVQEMIQNQYSKGNIRKLDEN